MVRLTGWDLLQVLVDEAIAKRPYGDKFEVLRAGYNTVNGIYQLDPSSYPCPHDDVPKYLKVDGSRLMIFRYF